jgi:hypothetical protein
MPRPGHHGHGAVAVHRALVHAGHPGHSMHVGHAAHVAPDDDANIAVVAQLAGQLLDALRQAVDFVARRLLLAGAQRRLVGSGWRTAGLGRAGAERRGDQQRQYSCLGSSDVHVISLVNPGAS